MKSNYEMAREIEADIRWLRLAADTLPRTLSGLKYSLTDIEVHVVNMRERVEEEIKRQGRGN